MVRLLIASSWKMIETVRGESDESMIYAFLAVVFLLRVGGHMPELSLDGGRDGNGRNRQIHKDHRLWESRLDWRKRTGIGNVLHCLQCLPNRASETLLLYNCQNEEAAVPFSSFQLGRMQLTTRPPMIKLPLMTPPQLCHPPSLLLPQAIGILPQRDPSICKTQTCYHRSSP